MRASVSRRTELGVRALEIMNAGQLLPEELISAIVADRFRRGPAAADFLLEGHPRSPGQARALDELLQELGTPLDAVVHLRLSEEEVERRVRRQAARRLCRNDSTHVFEPEVDRSVISGVCNVCGGELFQREDDKETRIRGRFSSYEAMEGPVTEYYARQQLLVTIDAVGTTDENTRHAIAALKRI
jgi:adenylate kinase